MARKLDQEGALKKHPRQEIAECSKLLVMTLVISDHFLKVLAMRKNVGYDAEKADRPYPQVFAASPSR